MSVRDVLAGEYPPSAGPARQNRQLIIVGNSKAEYDLPLELRLNEKGFEFYLKADHVVQDIPAYFTGVRKVGAKIHFTCADLVSEKCKLAQHLKPLKALNRRHR